MSKDKEQIDSKTTDNSAIKQFIPTKLNQLYSLAKDTLEAIKIPFEVAKAKKDLEKEIICIEQSIAEKELSIQDAKQSRPFNINKIIDTVDDKELLERKLKQANSLLEELF